MALLEWLNKIDTELLLATNNCNSQYFDFFFTFFTDKIIWTPLYLIIILLLIKKYKHNGLWLILFLIVSIAISDQLSGLLKVTIERLRPTHAPGLQGMLNMPIGKRGLYGFVSSHASNSFALAIIISLLSKSKRIWIAMFAWAVLTSYSRVYLAVHYPFDVICGAALGSAIGWAIYRLILIFDNQLQRKKIQIAGKWETQLTNTLALTLGLSASIIGIIAQLLSK